MEKDRKNTKNERLGDPYKHENQDSRPPSHKTDNSGNDSLNQNKDGDTQNDDTDKYLAMEQPGVTYTKNHDPLANSDQINPYENNRSDEWKEEGGNSRYSDAFNQDDYILNDNLDLDEDQNQSISSDDDDFEETNERYTN